MTSQTSPAFRNARLPMTRLQEDPTRGGRKRLLPHPSAVAWFVIFLATVITHRSSWPRSWTVTRDEAFVGQFLNNEKGSFKIRHLSSFLLL